MPKSKPIKVKIDLDGETYGFIKEVMKLSNKSFDTVMNVIVAIGIIKLDRHAKRIKEEGKKRGVRKVRNNR